MQNAANGFAWAGAAAYTNHDDALPGQNGWWINGRPDTGTKSHIVNQRAMTGAHLWLGIWAAATAKGTDQCLRKPV